MRLRMKPGPKPVKRATSLSFSAEDLAALGRLLAAGLVMLPNEQKPAAVARLKAAMTRLKVPVPNGL